MLTRKLQTFLYDTCDKVVIWHLTINSAALSQINPALNMITFQANKIQQNLNLKFIANILIRCSQSYCSQQYLIMLDHLTFNSRKSPFLQPADSTGLQQRVITLEQQIAHLNNIIVEKDQALEAIREAFFCSKSKQSEIIVCIEQQLKQFQLQQQQSKSPGNIRMRQQAQKMKKLTEAILCDLQRSLTRPWQIQMIPLITHKYFSRVTGQSEEEQESDDSSLEQQPFRRIYEVPVEMVVCKELDQDSLEAAIQPSRSYLYELPIQFYSIQEIPVQLGTRSIEEQEFIAHPRKIFELEVQMDQIFEIPGQLGQPAQFPHSFSNNRNLSQVMLFEAVEQPIKLAAHNQKLKQDLQKLLEQISFLKQANQNLSLEKQKTKIVEVPIQIIRLVETPIELQPFQVSYIQAQLKQIQTTSCQTQTQAAFEPFQIQQFKLLKQIIIRQVPIQVFVEKLVQIPIEVVIQKIVQVPIQVIIQRIVEVPKIQIRETPIQVLLQRQVFIQVQKQVYIEVEKQVYIEVEKQVYLEVEKQVYVEVEKHVPVFVPIIKQLPIELQMQLQQVQIEKFIPIFVPIIKQIPIQVEIATQTTQFFGREVIKQVKVLVEVPVVVFLQAEQPIKDKQLQLSRYQTQRHCELLQQSNFRLKQHQVGSEQPLQEQKCKIFELPIELELQKIVQVERIVEKIIEKEKFVQKIVQVFVQRVVEVQKIIQKQVVKEIFIDRIRQIPIQCIVQVPTNLDVQIHYDGQMFEIQNLQEANLKEYSNIAQTKTNNLQLFGKQIDQIIKFQPLRSNLASSHRAPQETVLQYKMSKTNMQSNVILFEPEDCPNMFHNKDMLQIIVQLPYQQQKASVNDEGTQTCLQSAQAETQSIRRQSNKKPTSQITIYELPIQLELVQNQKAQREQQLRFQERLNFPSNKLQDQITQLHVLIQQMEEIIREKQVESQVLCQKIEVTALSKSEIQAKYYYQTTKYQEQLAQISQKLEKQCQRNSINQASIQRLKDELLNSRKQINQIHIYQIPVENQLIKESNQIQIQTQHIDLFQDIEFIQVPIGISNAQQITQIQPQNQDQEDKEDKEEQEEDKEEQEEDKEEHQEHEQEQQEQEPQEQELEAEEEELLDNFLELIQEQELIKDLQTYPFKQIQSELLQFSPHHEESQPAQIQDNLEQKEPIIYQIPVKLIQLSESYEQEQEREEQIPYESEVYEIPVEIKIQVESTHVAVQTDLEEVTLTENRIFEVPIQFLEIRQEKDIQNVFNNQKNLEVKKQVKADVAKALAIQNIMALRITPQKTYPKLFLKSKTCQTIIQRQKNGYIHQNTKHTNRIYQIPIQMDIINNQRQENVNSETQTQLIKLRLTNNLIHVQQLLTKHQQKGETVPIYSQCKLQNQIFRHGPDITLNMQNISRVQSLTPGGLLASLQSYYKFPSPQINNISIINKEQMSVGKFFGSLDIRQEILNRDDPIASLRLVNKKLQGFEHQSSDGDSHNTSRQMIIEESETVISKDMNRIHTPNLEPHDLNFSYYANLQAKNYQIEEQQHSYNQQNEILITKTQKLKQQIEQYKARIRNLVDGYEQQKHQYENNLENVKNELLSANRQIWMLKQQIEKNKCLFEQNEQFKSQLKKQNQYLIQACQKFKQDAKRQEKQVNRQIQRLQNLIEEKKAEVKDAQLQLLHNKKLHQQQLNEIKEYVESNKQQIQKLNEEIQDKNDKNDQLQAAIQDMRKSIAQMKHLQTDASALYQQQFQRIRYGFEAEKREKDMIIEELKNEIERLNTEVQNQQTKLEQQCQANDSLQKQLDEIRQAYSQLHHLKDQVEDKYTVVIKQLKVQIEQTKHELVEKDELINKTLQQTYSGKIEEISSKVKIQYLQTNVFKNSQQEIDSLQQYSRKLQSIILKYEEKLVLNHHTIEELQEKMCQYLNDALQKEQQAENLYLKLIQFENTVNNLLIEKVTLQIQNRKQSKFIQQAEKKLKLLGNRLIEVARQRAQYDSAEQDGYQQ